MLKPPVTKRALDMHLGLRWPRYDVLCLPETYHMAGDCPNKRDRDSANSSWKSAKTQGEHASEAYEDSPTTHHGRQWTLGATEQRAGVLYSPKADQNIVPKAMVDGLQALQPQLQVAKLASPFVGTECNQMPF
ncbi:hypothetical protein DYB28_008346 [Aphanomyces astaci]|nr:hypothetical protein DYB28_008346 [Aphanomyces astaci]